MKKEAIELIKESLDKILECNILSDEGAQKHVRLYANRAKSILLNLETDSERYSIIFEMGIYYGYPMCCIDEYAKDSINSTQGRIAHRNSITGGNKIGFVPCTKHSIEIQAGLLTIKDLITNRVSKDPI